MLWIWWERGIHTHTYIKIQKNVCVDEKQDIQCFAVISSCKMPLIPQRWIKCSFPYECQKLKHCRMSWMADWLAKCTCICWMLVFHCYFSFLKIKFRDKRSSRSYIISYSINSNHSGIDDDVTQLQSSINRQRYG